MRVGSLVRYYSVTSDNVCGLGIITKVHEMVDYNGHTRVDVHWLDLGIRTETVRTLREITCK